jgi:hypothetical protein
LAAEGARMTNKEPSPPRLAEAVLRLSLRPSDREPISGDLLEEYRVTRRPTLGALRANAWYIKHVVSVVWHLIRVYALVLAAQSVLLAVTVFRPGHHAPNFRPEMRHTVLTMAMVKGVLYGSIAPAPGVSLFDALIYFAAGYHGVQRTRLIRTGLLADCLVLGAHISKAVTALRREECRQAARRSSRWWSPPTSENATTCPSVRA